MPKDEVWFQSLNWSKVCIECQKENNGTCQSRSCAEMNYDENGNLIPARSITYDGDYKRLSRPKMDDSDEYNW